MWPEHVIIKNGHSEITMTKDQDSYEIYRSAGFSGVKVLLKSEGDFNYSKRYHEIDISKSLKDNLSAKSIVEHPIVMIILNHHSDSFNLCEESDEDLGSDTNDSNRNGIALTSPRNSNLTANMESISDKLETNRGANQTLQNQTAPNRSIVQQSNMPATSDNQAPSTSKREAEFNKSCYDFYLNYYSEKYGLNNMQLTNVTSSAPQIQSTQNSIPISSERITTKTGILPHRTIDIPSTQSTATKNSMTFSETEEIASERSESSKDGKSKSNIEVEVRDKPNHSLSLLAVYSDSEEDMDT